MSVMEMSHRGKEFMSIAEQAEADLRELMAIPAGYKVLFLQAARRSSRDGPDNLLRGKTAPTTSTPRRLVEEGHRRGQAYCTGQRRASSEASKLRPRRRRLSCLKPTRPT